MGTVMSRLEDILRADRLLYGGGVLGLVLLGLVRWAVLLWGGI